MNFSSNTNNTKNTEGNDASQRNLIREIEFSIESLKCKLFEKLDAIKQISFSKVSSTATAIAKPARKSAPNVLNAEALKNFEKTLSKEMESLKYELINGERPFDPSVVHTIEVNANIGFNYGANVYNQKQNMIISCPSNSFVHFVDATSYQAIRSRKKKQISSSVVQMSYWPETDTHLMGCAFGDIYAYNATKNDLYKVTKEGDSFVLAISHISDKSFAFSSNKTGKLFFGKLNGEKPVAHNSNNSDAWYLHHDNQNNLLFSGLANGKIAIYDTKDEKTYNMVDCIQAHRFGKYVTVIKTIKIDGKDYIITGGNDHTIKIFQNIKGKMKLLKVIQNSEDVSTIVYLENYKMIATTHHKDYVKFFKVPSGKLEATLNVGLTKARNIFLMEDKNCLGVADLTKNYIKVIQLHPNMNKAEL